MDGMQSLFLFLEAILDLDFERGATCAEVDPVNNLAKTSYRLCPMMAGRLGPFTQQSHENKPSHQR